MAATTVLHIQGREEAPPRVVELDGRAIRVGRGRHCEVRLEGSRLADVMIVLRKTIDGWQVQPLGPPGMISVYGEPVGQRRTLGVDVPLRIGDYWLTLRSVESRVGSFDEPIVVEPDVETETVEARLALVDLTAPPEPDSDFSTDLAAQMERLREWEARLAGEERRLKEQREAQARQALWKSAAERLRKPVAPSTPRAVEPRPTIPRIPTASSELLRPAPTRRVDPRPDRPSPRPPHPPTRSVASRVPTAAPQARARVEPMPSPRTVEHPPRAVEVAVEVIAEPTVDLSAYVAETTTPAHEVHHSSAGLLDWDAEIECDVVTGFEEEAPAESEFEPIKDLGRATTARTAQVHAPEPEPEPAEPEAEPEPRPAASRTARARSVDAPRVAERSFGVDPAYLEARKSIPDPSAARYPTARAILEAQGRREVADPLRTRHRATGPRPTESRAPEAWNAPFWLAALPALAMIVGLGGGGTALSAVWAYDSERSSQIYGLALREEGEAARSLDPEIRPSSAWYRATPTRLAAWALALERSGEGPDAHREAVQLLEAARHIAPLHPTVRYVLAQTEPTGSPLAALGLARDPASLALAAKKLRAAGKKADAVRLYRSALELAVREGDDPKSVPSFDDDPRMRRYRLPEESPARPILNELADAADWPYAEWAEAVPALATARLAAARVLKEKGKPEAEPAFDAVLAGVDAPEDAADSHWAARAEALAFRNRTDEAAECYRKALALAGTERRSRMFSYNLAEILRSSTRDQERAELLRAAVGEDTGEEVARRALEAQALLGPTIEPTVDAAVEPAAGEATPVATESKPGAP